MLRNLSLKRKERPATPMGVRESNEGFMKSFFGGAKRRPVQPHYIKSSELISKISSPIILNATIPEFVSDLPPRCVSTPPRPTTRPSFPPIPIRVSSTAPSSPTTPLNIIKKKASNSSVSFYNLKSLSTTHLHSLSSKFSSSRTDLLVPDIDILNFPAPPPRSLIALAPPQIGALGLSVFEPLGLDYSLLPSATITSSEEDFGRRRSTIDIFDVIMESDSESEYGSELIVTPDNLESRRPSTSASIYTPIPIRISERKSPKTTTLPTSLPSPDSTAPPGPDLDAPTSAMWKRASVALSCSSLFFDTDEGDDFSPSQHSYASSSSGSSEPECKTPTSELAELPLSPKFLGGQDRKKGSLSFPSRASASCISLGRF